MRRGVTTELDPHLQVVPSSVYKVDDPGNTRTSSFLFDIAVVRASDRDVAPIFATVELSNGGSVVQRQEWTAELLAKIVGVRYRILPDTPIASPRRMFTLPEAFDLHFYFRCHQALAIDGADIRVTVADPAGGRTELTLRFPIQYYEQRTSLIFPFRGRGHVGQDWGTNGGHGGGIGTDFAIDVIGLDKNYAAQKDDADDNTSAWGWGREILAPAAGTVTYARNDVPDNPGAHPDINTFAALPDPVLAYLGNAVIIDHGNSEHSVMAHLQHGAVTVRVGERVAAGHVIGKLGNSGDSYGPHLHYQLQSGPRPFADQSVPFKFENVDAPQLSRGSYFDAK